MLTSDPGSPAADSYASVAAADAYHAARRSASAWAALTTDEKEAALREATDYMLQEYRSRWKGQRVNISQALDWPRVGATIDSFDVYSSVIPTEVVKACCEFALKASTGALSPDKGPQVLSKEVGPLKVVYQNGARQGMKYESVDNLLGPLLAPSGGLKMVRA